MFDTSNDVHQITERIFIEKGKQFAWIEDTLLFIDELQEAPHVVNLLRYYKEEMPQLAVIAAGSMLETLLGKNITFPVGRVEYKVLRPVSFEEFTIGNICILPCMHCFDVGVLSAAALRTGVKECPLCRAAFDIGKIIKYRDLA